MAFIKPDKSKQNNHTEKSLAFYIVHHFMMMHKPFSDLRKGFMYHHQNVPFKSSSNHFLQKCIYKLN